jgi:Cellulase (glycosyl hydrolase family 5)
VANFPVTFNIPNRLVFAIHSYPPDVDLGAQNPASWNPSWGYLYTEGIAPFIITEYGYTGVDSVSGSANYAAVQAWISTLYAYVNGASSGGIAGIPANGYGPSMAWFCLNASGPNCGDGSAVNNADMCLLSATDWQTILPGQFAALPPVMFYAKS